MTEPHPSGWYKSEKELQDIFQDEYDLYESGQNVRQIAADERQAAFAAEIKRLTTAFDEKEEEIEQQTENMLYDRIKAEGVDTCRRTMIPAYTFTRFLELPKELQLRIWFMAARIAEPRDLLLLPETEQLHPEATRVDFLQRREDESEFETPYPALLGLICKDARAAALQVYAPVAWKDGSRHFFNYFKITHGFANKLYDIFHIYGSYSKNYRLFQNMIHARKKDIALDQVALDNIHFFSKIRVLVVDLNLFVHTPTSLWSQFASLEEMTVAFYPHLTIYYHNSHSVDSHSLVHPAPNTLYGQRAEWLHDEITRAFKIATTGWKLPKINIAQFTSELGRFVVEFDNLEFSSSLAESSISWDMIRGDGFEEDDGEDEHAFERFHRLDHPWYRQVRATLRIARVDQEDRET